MAVFGDDLVGGGVDEGVDFVVALLGAVPGVGDVFVAAGVDFVQEKVDPGRIELAAGDAAHIVDDVAGHGVYFVKTLKISRGKAAGALAADVDAVIAGDFLRKGVGGLAGVVAVGAGAVDLPIQAGGDRLTAENAFGEGAAADISETNHQNAF